MSGKRHLVFKPDDDAGEGNERGEGEQEFIVAGGDAAEGFEFGEEIFDAVTFATEVLVKSGFGCTINFRGYRTSAVDLK